jgi:cellulose synthase/poly-beta-1,6-N-acetylglucosamine synthase-like glycosyltransferase
MASASIASSRPDDQGPSPGGGLPAPWWPLVTIIMPIRNEARYIARALHAVLAQDYPVDKMEIFVNEASPQQAAGYHKEGHCL